MIEQHVIETVKDKARLEEVVDRLYGATRKGREYRINCPSCRKVDAMHVNPTKQLAKCFKCGAGSNGALSFLQRYAGKTFPEAVQYLADMYQVVIN